MMKSKIGNDRNKIVDMIRIFPSSFDRIGERDTIIRNADEPTI
jgi:hypothetical protein